MTTMTTMTLGWGGPRVEVKVIRRNPTRCWTPTFCMKLRFCIIQNSANSLKFITPATIYTIYFHHPNLYIVTLYHIISSVTYHEDATWYPLVSPKSARPDLMGTTDGRMPKQTPNGSAIATFVNFRMLHPQEVSTGQFGSFWHSDAFGTEMSPFFSHFTLLFSVAALYSSLYFPTPHKFIKKTYITKISQKTKDSQCWNSLSM